MTWFSAATICLKPAAPSVSATGVSTSKMSAPGAMACEYSTSSDVSIAQSLSVALPLYGGILPSGAMISKLGGAGIENDVSKLARSDLISGDPKESTMTMVTPVPVSPLDSSGLRL